MSVRPSRSTSAGASRSRSRRARVATSTRYAATRPEVPHHRLEGFGALSPTIAAFLRAESLERIVEELELIEQRVVLLHGEKHGARLTALGDVQRPAGLLQPLEELSQPPAKIRHGHHLHGHAGHRTTGRTAERTTRSMV